MPFLFSASKIIICLQSKLGKLCQKKKRLHWAPAKHAYTCLVLVWLFLNSHILYLKRGGGGGGAGGDEGLPIMTYTGRRSPEVYLFQGTPHHFFFFNFWRRQAKETTGKKVLKLVKLPSFESDLLKTKEDIAPQSREILQAFAWHWGPGTNLLSPSPLVKSYKTNIYLTRTFHRTSRASQADNPSLV